MRKLAQKARHSAKDYSNGVTGLDLAHTDLIKAMANKSCDYSFR